ncbi:hypothetical protein BDK51DRAFT_49620 [Blyttiomyces helicus]|uniref:Uncharacterized protein n=1 Tax=Blyttiomyces helicus TaxID=388810 RepID=A0A4P9WML9_9FUNG|nr:hypothetical protein BDK51DRAFT_49620 [Blyttiomyces helicus]|eukprot:RKO94319.1 hypothetical protein BDK51DRAFT_49620 [Blyttiomyces helicus]
MGALKVRHGMRRVVVDGVLDSMQGRGAEDSVEFVVEGPGVSVRAMFSIQKVVKPPAHLVIFWRFQHDAGPATWRGSGRGSRHYPLVGLAAKWRWKTSAGMSEFSNRRQPRLEPAFFSVAAAKNAIPVMKSVSGPFQVGAVEARAGQGFGSGLPVPAGGRGGVCVLPPRSCGRVVYAFCDLVPAAGWCMRSATSVLDYTSGFAMTRPTRSKKARRRIKERSRRIAAAGSDVLSRCAAARRNVQSDRELEARSRSPSSGLAQLFEAAAMNCNSRAAPNQCCTFDPGFLEIARKHHPAPYNSLTRARLAQHPTALAGNLGARQRPRARHARPHHSPTRVKEGGDSGNGDLPFTASLPVCCSR